MTETANTITPEDVAAAVADTEDALLDLTTRYQNGTLGDMDFDDVVDLTTRASQSVNIAAGAFGFAADPHDTPDALRDRMLSMYTRSALDVLSRNVAEADERKAADLRNSEQACMTAMAGLSKEDLERLDFDREHGDTSPWLKVREDYLFG